MRFLASLVLVPFVAACTSTSTVPGGSLAGLHAASGDGAILTDDEGSRVRIDANSELRFQRVDGSWTSWHRAGKLYANREGVFIPHRASLAEIDRVVVAGANETDVGTLRATATASDVLSIETDGAVVLTGSIVSWLARFTAATGGDISGVWSFHARSGEWFSGYQGAALAGLPQTGIVGHDGLKFADVSATEVKNLNGGQTVVATAAITVVAIGIVALIAAAPKSKAPPEPTHSAVVHPAPVSHVHVIMFSSGPPPPSPVTMPPSEDQALWKPGFIPPAADGSRRLFDESARRRASTRFGAALDAGMPLGHGGPGNFSAVPMLRFSNIFELGAGVRFIGQDVPSGTALQSVFLARIGVHGELDAHRRFAVPLSLDLGVGSNVDFHARLNLGLRVRLTDSMWLGIHPFNPTYTRFDSATGPTARLWTFPTMFETSFAF